MTTVSMQTTALSAKEGTATELPPVLGSGPQGLNPGRGGHCNASEGCWRGKGKQSSLEGKSGCHVREPKEGVTIT